MTVLRCCDPGAALFTLAHLAQVIPGVDAAGVAVIPGNAHGITAYWLYFFWTRGFLIHRQQGAGSLWRLSRFAMIVVALFVAGSARAGIAQPLKVVVRLMAVVPLNINARASGDVHLDGFGIVRHSRISIYGGFIGCRSYAAQPERKTIL